MSSRRYDGVVLGGGPAGVATALALVEQGARILIVEGSHYEAARIGETLSPALAGPLRRLRLRETFEATGPLASFGIRSAWGSGHLRDRSYVFDPRGMGWHVDRRRLDAALAATAEARGAVVWRGQRCAFSHRSAGRWSLTLTDGVTTHEVFADVVVDATGRRASFARRRSNGRVIHDRLVAIVACLAGPHFRSQDAGPALVEAVEEGWWYSSAVPGDRLVLALMTDADLHPRAAISDLSYWTHQLGHRVSCWPTPPACWAAMAPVGSRSATRRPRMTLCRVMVCSVP